MPSLVLARIDAVLSSMGPTGLDAIRENPARAALATVGMVIGTAIVGFALRKATRHLTSLRAQLLILTFAGIAVGAAAAVVLARLMIFDEKQLTTVIAVLALTGAFAMVLVFVASITLGNDVQRLETTVRSIEAGDRSVRAGIHRNDELGHVATALDHLNGLPAGIEKMVLVAVDGLDAEQQAA